MPDITNPQAVRFANENCRILADAMEVVFRTADQFMLNVVRDWEALPDIQAALDGDVIIDGSAQDGRTVMTKLNVAQLKFVVGALITMRDTNDNHTLVNNWVTNGQPKF